MNNLRSNKAYYFLNTNIGVENVISLVLFVLLVLIYLINFFDKYKYKNMVMLVGLLARQYLYSQELCIEVQCLTFAA